jgi:hypothetical protein
MTRIACGVAVLWGLALGGTARAQAVYVPNQWEDRPKTEIAGTLNVLSIFGPGEVGARVTRRLNPWVSLEFATDHQNEGIFGPDHRLFIGAVRIAAPFEPRRRPSSITEGPASVFATLGAARAIGLPWRVSPMFGFGVQSAYVGERVAVRFEIQRFTRGPVSQGSYARLMVSAVVGLPI